MAAVVGFFNTSMAFGAAELLDTYFCGPRLNTVGYKSTAPNTKKCRYSNMVILEVDGISKKGEKEFVLNNISFTQNKLQKIAIAGETGSGKSSLMKIIAGSGEPDAGEVRFEGKKVPDMREKLLPGHKGIAYLTQYFELQKFLTVGQILGYANTLPETAAQALYELCRISHLLGRRTDQLSGGEKQRTALARLLTTSPRLLLLDEPFSNLDMVHKNILKSVIHDIGDQLGITCILVSHDPLDTLSWADEIVVMKAGEIVQKGTPLQVYRQPASEYVAGLFGSYNLIGAEAIAGFANIFGNGANGQSFFLRPEDVLLSNNDTNGVIGEVLNVSFFGSHYDIKVAVGETNILARLAGNHFQKGDIVGVSINKEKMWYL
jgi:ABC-type sugar transport system ATPase subunit